MESRSGVDADVVIADAASAVPNVKPQFRPDIEGMRTIAVGLVLLYHFYDKPFTGGFVGVDVFFVISGFLITALLLRERSRTGRISVIRFYARRVRRILPASTLAVMATLFAGYYFLGFIAGNSIAIDAQWTAIFAANVHFALVGTDYLGSQLPPSPLQHMWSLGVEEQFYVVWPALFLAIVLIVRGARHRGGLAAILAAIIAASFAWSVIETTTNATWAYFSPLTRAWELALGALIAVSAPAIAAIAKNWLYEVCAIMGIAGIAGSALLFTGATPYPGYAVALPVVGSGLLIAAGCGNPATSIGRLLSWRPMQWIGARSYSLYIWHWPVLTIATQFAGHELNGWQKTGLLALSVVLSALSYRLVENPIRHSKMLASRTWLALLFGLVLIGGTVVAAQWLIVAHYGSWSSWFTSES
jgi:peptidoglycan/LPS O-acetylase OafA/YrhL